MFRETLVLKKNGWAYRDRKEGFCLCSTITPKVFPAIKGCAKVILSLSTRSFKGSKRFMLDHRQTRDGDYDMMLMAGGIEQYLTTDTDNALRKALNRPMPKSFVFYALLEPAEGGGRDD